MPWLVLTTLGGPADAGLVGAGIVLPAVFGAVAGGVVIDLFGARRTSVLADVASGVTVAAVPIAALTVGLSLPLLLVLAFLGAVLDAPGATARQVLIPDLAERAEMPLERANGIYQAVDSASLLIGPAVAGLAVVALGPTGALWLDAVSFLVSAVLVRAFVPLTRVITEETEVADLGAGIRLLARDGVLRLLTFAAVIANFVGTPLFVVVLPALATREGFEADELGLMLAAFGGGLVAGALILARAGRRVSRARLLIGGFAGTGVALAAAATGASLGWMVAWLFLAGLASGPINPIAFTVMQERVPAELRGRAFGALLGGVLVAAPAGMLVIGALAEATAPRFPLVVAGITFVGVAVLLALRSETRAVDPAYAPEPIPT